MGATRGRSLDYDIVRGLGIVLVVWGHVWRAMEAAGLIGNDRLFARIDDLVYSFHMPLFFLLSGLFFRPEAGLRAFLRLRVQLMVWPLLLWSWVEAGFLLVAGRFSNRGALSLEEALLFPFPPKSVFWFLFALLICHLVAYALARLLPRWQKPAILGFGLALLIGRGLGLDFGLFTMFSIHFLYFALGYLRILPAPRAEAGWGGSRRAWGFSRWAWRPRCCWGRGPI